MVSTWFSLACLVYGELRNSLVFLKWTHKIDFHCGNDKEQFVNTIPESHQSLTHSEINACFLFFQGPLGLGGLASGITGGIGSLVGGTLGGINASIPNLLSGKLHRYKTNSFPLVQLLSVARLYVSAPQQQQQPLGGGLSRWNSLPVLPQAPQVGKCRPMYWFFFNTHRRSSIDCYYF